MSRYIEKNNISISEMKMCEMKNEDKEKKIKEKL
jgi:hypothetical protein